jgi:hypothetical protein
LKILRVCEVDRRKAEKIMSAYQFDAVIEDGAIRIPGKYANKLTKKVRVVVMPEKDDVIDKASLFPNLHLDTRGYKFDREEANAR